MSSKTEFEQCVQVIKDHVGKFPDFPKKGIVFRDIFTAMTHGPVCQALKRAVILHVQETCPDIDVVVGLDARGFLFSLLIASELGIGCVPVRKKGKLPGECYKFEYVLEYGTDTFEMQKDSIKPGQKVLLVDDLLATGGSLNAAANLVRQAQGNVVEALVIMELTELKGREKIKGIEVHSLIQYDD
ncbi:adenine phosphoribosyltransferase [Culicoides brevitarsis]|uniref:adenine phosphoribosyltransferase n=1 Tax=Culicoides brevitarsis TaxID=469753 RepID=UPI00307B368A